MISAILLAAGKSKRMNGENKLTKNLHGIPIIKKSVENILSSPVDKLIVVLGYEKDSIQKEIDDGYKVILFPEGTTSDGIRILNFKSSLLSSVENQDYLIQPIIIKYEYINGLPLNRCLKPIIAWYGDMGLKKHLLNVLKLFSITAKVSFLNPIFAKDFENRKIMTFALQNVIFNEYSQKNNVN